MKLFLLISMIFFSAAGFAQFQTQSMKLKNNSLFNDGQHIQTDSGIFISHFYIKACKNVLISGGFIPKSKKITPVSTDSFILPKIKFLTIHGNVTYDFFYRSKSDTPIAQQNCKQHTERVYLNLLVKEKYPLKLAFVLRQSNSPFFKNFADVNFQFDQFGYRKNLKQEILNRLSKSLENRPDIKTLEALLAETEKKFLTMKRWLESPATLQKVIEERERQYAQQYQQDNNTDEFISTSTVLHSIQQLKNKRTSIENKFKGSKEDTDSITATFNQLYEDKKAALDSLSMQAKQLQERVDSVKNLLQKNLQAARQKIYAATNEKDLIKIAADNGIDAGKQNKFERKLAAIQRFSVGRSMIDYTELTAQNITITGLNIEYKPSYYAAFAAGKIDYRFRDFLNKRSKNTGQYLVLGRFGIGDPAKRAIILTVFKGRKNSSEYALSDTFTNHVNIVGYSIESLFKKDENTSISFEVAKSTKPITGNLQNNKEINALWKFSDQTNLGVNVKAQTVLKETNTKLSGFFRKTGENFQSFSLFSYNTDQTAWLARADQYFFKENVTISGMLRRNDFTNPFTDKTYKTSTVFKSILLNIRIPKYPSISLGYYPGSQLYVVNKEKIRENAYYIMNGSIVYNYFYKGIGMNSSLVYNQYLNKATDSGFVLYKGSSYYGMQTIYLKRLQLQAGYAYNNQPELKYFTLESSGDYSLSQFLKIGAGAKYNKITGGNKCWGERIQLGADFKHLGSLQFQYEKSYLPAINQTLYPVETGRISWYKYF